MNRLPYCASKILKFNMISDMLKITAKYEQPNFAHIWHFSLCNFAYNYGKIGILILV